MADQKIIDVIRDYLENIPENLSFVGETQVYFDSLSGKRNDYSPLGTDSARLSKKFRTFKRNKASQAIPYGFCFACDADGAVNRGDQTKNF